MQEEEFYEKLNVASRLMDKNRFDDAIAMGKQLLEEEVEIEEDEEAYKVKTNVGLCWLACDLIVNSYAKKFNETGKDPLPNSTEYIELHRYMKMLLESYDRLDSVQREFVTDDIEKSYHQMRPLLSLMEEGKPISEPLEAKKNGGCFIATACFGDYDASEVLVLRKFRDEILLTTPVGRLFVATYYSLSPTFANFLEVNTFFKIVVRNLILKPIIYLIRSWR